MLFEGARLIPAACLHTPRRFAILAISLWPHPARNVERRKLRMSNTAFSTRVPSCWAIACACARAVTGCGLFPDTPLNPLEKNLHPFRSPCAPSPGHARIAVRSTTAARGEPSGNTSFCAVPWFAAAAAARDILCRGRLICPARPVHSPLLHLVKALPNVINLRPWP